MNTELKKNQLDQSNQSNLRPIIETAHH